MDRVVDACRRAHAWRSSHQFLGRYSVDKLQQFAQYQLQTSVARSALVIALSFAVPFVILVTVMAIASSDPDDKIAVSVQSAVGHTVVGTALGLRSRQALSIPASESPRSVSLVIGVVVGFGTELFRLLLLLLAGTWQTAPLPMGEVFVSIAQAAIFVSTSFAFMKKSLRRRWTKVRTYTVVIVFQGGVIGGFLLLALAFQSATYEGQLLLILVHPALRVAATKLMWLQTRKLNDLTTDVTICFAEIAGLLSLTLCLLRVRGPELGILLVLTDLTLVSLDMYVYASREYVVDGVSTLHTSAKIIEGALDTLCGPDAVDEVRDATEGLTDGMPARMQSYVARPNAPAFSTTASKVTHVSTSEPDAGQLFRKSGAIVLAKARDERVPATEGVERIGFRRTASDSLGGDSDSIKVMPRTSSRGSKTGRVQLKPIERRGMRINESATLSRRRESGGRSNSVFVSSSSITIATDIPRVGAGVSLPQDFTMEARTESTTRTNEITEAQREAATAVRPPKSKRRSSAHAAYATPSAVATSMPTPTATTTTSPGELMSSRMRRRASSVFLTPRLFHDHGSKRLMNLSGTPTPSTVTKSSGQAVRPAGSVSRPSQVKIDGLSVTRKDQARILEQTLQLIFSFEALTVVQFLHVLVPVVTGLVLHVLWFLPSRHANVLLRDASCTQVASMAAVATAFGALEAVPLAVLCRSTRKRFGLQPAQLLSFVLEQYWMSFYGKLVGALVTTFFFLSLPFGAASAIVGDT